jgi:hypothetical protein
MTFTRGSVLNLAIMAERSDVEKVPSIRTNFIFCDWRRGSIRSNVVFQHEKTMLDERSDRFM